MPRRTPDRRSTERGQVLVLFALMVMAMLFMAALLFDGGHALVYRRTLQGAADAGALAGANVMQTGTSKGCNGGGGSTPRALVQSAATAAAQQNMGSTNGTITVTCPAGYSDATVQVTISGTSPSFFAGALSLATPSGSGYGASGIPVSASGSAIHGGTNGARFSVVELNPHNPTWQSGNRGCPSVLFSGNPTVVFEGSMQVNSACPASMGGAIGTNGGPTLSFNNGA